MLKLKLRKDFIKIGNRYEWGIPTKGIIEIVSLDRDLITYKTIEDQSGLYKIGVVNDSTLDNTIRLIKGGYWRLIK